MMIKVLDRFTPQKTSDIFHSVEFTYGDYKWNGVIPQKIEHQGFEISDAEMDKQFEKAYVELNPTKKAAWITRTNIEWTDKQKTSATYNVLAALFSGEWECRVCGPVRKASTQCPSRLRILRKDRYVIGSKTRKCEDCKKKTMHDILVMLPSPTIQKSKHELRKPMSIKLKNKIKKFFDNKDSSSGRTLTAKELIIDHKFASQRWGKPETDNPDSMSEDAIRNKFQLLTNQGNTLKSRYCDTCVKTGKRGSFMDIEWYYLGDENWVGDIKDNEEGCKGCPWYDLELWKSKLLEKLKSS
jgi:hypothetical protein